MADISQYNRRAVKGTTLVQLFGTEQIDKCGKVIGEMM